MNVNRREFLKNGSLSLAAAGMGALTRPLVAEGSGSTAKKRPNVLYIFSDMQRAHSMGCYGDKNARTPTLDRFASQGARCDAAMSNTPVCCPHRASLMTGQYAHHHGMVSNGVDFLPKVQCFGEAFRNAGYETAYVGKWHLNFPKRGSDERRFGFPAVGAKYALYKTEHVVKPFADKAIEFIQELSASPKPWMCVLSWLPPHAPYEAAPGYAGHFPSVQLLPNVPADRPRSYASQCLPDYYGMIEEIDTNFARILAELDKAGVADDTIVVYSSDHGDMIGSHGYTAKRWPYEESVHVPLLVRYPRSIKPGTVVADPLGTPDIYPTLAGLADVKIPAGLDGLDFSGLLTGSGIAPRDHVYLEMHYAFVPWPGWRGLRTRQYSYARTVDKPWILYDLEKDPFQLCNLVDNRSSQTLVSELDRRLTSVMHEVGDSWNLRATTGDLSSWNPGGKKQHGNWLGVKWPGCAVSDDSGGKKKGGKKKRKGKPDDSGT